MGIGDWVIGNGEDLYQLPITHYHLRIPQIYCVTSCSGVSCFTAEL